MISTPAQRAEAPESDGRRLQRHPQRLGAELEVLRGAALALDAAALRHRRDAPLRLVETDGDADVVGEQGVADAGADAVLAAHADPGAAVRAVMLAEACARRRPI